MKLDFLIVASFIIGVISAIQYHEHNKNNIRHDERKYAWICVACLVLILILILNGSGEIIE